MVVVDRLSKMTHFIPTQGLPYAKSTADLFFHHVFRLHGTPETIISDRGPQFTSRFWKAFCTLLQISVCLSTAFHPHSNGQTERTNQTLEQYLRCYTSYLQDDWSDLLTSAEFAYNSQTHASIKQSPFFINYGFHPSVLPNAPPKSPLPMVNDHIRNLQQGFILAKNTLLESQNTYKKYADLHHKAAPAYQPSQKVWLSTKNLKLSCPTKKLGPKYIGPYPIISIVSPVAVRLQLHPSFRIHPVFHVSLLKPWTKDHFPQRSPPPPDPIPVKGLKEFEVQRILDSRSRFNRLEYLIQWKGYGPEENSWEPATQVHAPSRVRAFHLQHPSKPGPLRPQRGRPKRGVLSGHARPVATTVIFANV
uniref:Uncharacterized protein n=1 Tax=Leptobrachium leishanense TaxID=445787 RepID=A0A8C5Q8Z1_9ANUR